MRDNLEKDMGRERILCDKVGENQVFLTETVGKPGRDTVRSDTGTEVFRVGTGCRQGWLKVMEGGNSTNAET